MCILPEFSFRESNITMSYVEKSLLLRTSN
nr:MAG TPA: hypothetical protein [Caudoviricetes sp.]